MKNSTIEVKVDERFSVEKTLRKFKRMCNYGIVKSIKRDKITRSLR